MKFPVVKSQAVRQQDCPATVNTKETQHMTPNEKLESLLASDETTHFEVADALLEAIRWIDGLVGHHLEWEPEMEVTRKVMAAQCLFMLTGSLVKGFMSVMARHMQKSIAWHRSKRKTNI